MTKQHAKVFETQFADIGFKRVPGLQHVYKMMFYKKMYVATVYMIWRSDKSYELEVELIKGDGKSVYAVIYETQTFISDDDDKEFKDVVKDIISDINEKIALQGDKQ